MTEPYLKMENVCKSFPGVKALDNVNLNIFAGEAVGLVGANGAGKSTLMNVLGGVIHPDEGTISINGKHVRIGSPLEAGNNGIGFVHQEMAILHTMTVMENMFVSRFPKKAGVVIDGKAMREETRRILKMLGSEISPDMVVRNLSTGDMQMIEIGRCLLGNNKIFIFDEPTSSLTSREKNRLFEIIRNLKRDGYAIIYITHFLNELFEICEKISVLRGGRVVGSGVISELKMTDIVNMMVGEVEIARRTWRRTTDATKKALEVRHLNRKGILQDISFELLGGEVLGLWGLLGSGRTETIRALTGLDPVESMELYISKDGVLQKCKASKIKKSLGLITEERRGDGLFLSMSVKWNMSAAALRSLSSKVLTMVRRKVENMRCNEFIDRLSIKVSNPDQQVATLSGGNQQKVIVGRWLELNPGIIIMDEPTRGLDVSAKAEITQIIMNLASNGTSIILISSEIDEMMALCDRFLVLKKGKIIAALSHEEATKEKLMGLASGAIEYSVQGADI